MAIDIRGDRTCDLPVTSLLLGELLNHGAALPLKETLAVDAAIHICPHVTLFFSAFTLVFFFFFHNSYIFLGDLSQSRGDVANSPVNRLCFFFNFLVRNQTLHRDKWAETCVVCASRPRNEKCALFPALPRLIRQRRYSEKGDGGFG